MHNSNGKPTGKRSAARTLAIMGISFVVFSAAAAGAGNELSFSDFLLSPVRVHLLSEKDSPAIETTLTDADIHRIFGKLNHIWAQAGLQFYPESTVHEQAAETCPPPAVQVAASRLLELRPAESRDSNSFHVYYLKAMPNNGIYFPEAMFVKDTASLRPVPGGIDEPLPRVTSHELGHALGLSHRQNETNLMASGTSGIWLNGAEIQQARTAAAGLKWIASAPRAFEQAERLFEKHRFREAAVLYKAVAGLPVKDSRIELAETRLKQCERRQ